MSFKYAEAEEGFDNHISNSIRGYRAMTDDVVAMSDWYVEPYTEVLDVGCSTGLLALRISERHTRNRVVGIDIEKAFKEKQYEYSSSQNNLHLYSNKDFLKYSSSLPISYMTMLFTLQFMPREDRQKAVNWAYSMMSKGGALIITEKVQMQTPDIQDVITGLYEDFKHNSFSSKEIMDKKLELRSSMKLRTVNELEGSIRKAGFSIYRFWQNHAFVGYICIKR